MKAFFNKNELSPNRCTIFCELTTIFRGEIQDFMINSLLTNYISAIDSKGVDNGNKEPSDYSNKSY